MARSYLEQLIEEHGAEKVMQALIRYDSAKGLPSRLLNEMELNLSYTRATDRLAAIEVDIKGTKVSLKSLRQVFIDFSLEDFMRLAESVTSEVWHFGAQLTTLHYMVGRYMSRDTGKKYKGMLLKIILTSDAYIYEYGTEEGGGGAYVRRRKSNRIPKHMALAQAKVKFIQISNLLDDTLRLCSPPKKESGLII